MKKFGIILALLFMVVSSVYAQTQLERKTRDHTEAPGGLQRLISDYQKIPDMQGRMIEEHMQIPTDSQRTPSEHQKAEVYYEEKDTYTVERVIDGNTLKLTNGEEVQLIGIKASEDEKMGQEATELVKSIVEGKEVKLEHDVQQKDKYGRTLAYVYFTTLGTNWLQVVDGVAIEHIETKHIGATDKYLDDPDGKIAFKGSYPVNLNAYIVQKGYASPMTIPPNVKRADLFKELYEEAREAKRGMWKDNVTSPGQVTSRVMDEAKKISTSEFKKQYELRSMQTMKAAEFLGNKNGKAFLKIKTMSMINPEKWSEEIVYVELSDLDETFKASLSKKEE